MSDSPEELRIHSLQALIDILIQALHNADSALLVAQKVPNWQEELRQAFANPLRQQETEKLALLVRELSDALLEGRESEPEFVERLAAIRRELRKPPN